MSEQNKAIANSLVLDVFNTGNLDRLGEFFTTDYVEHAAPPGVPATIEGVKMFFTMFRAAFPDFHYTIDDVIAEDDKVVTRATGHGTMKGAFLGMPATGKSAAWSEIHITRFVNGKIAEHWANSDQMGMLQQLGLAPAPGG
jgi:steroid delta-isomerase-like uncharacterized protein